MTTVEECWEQQCEALTALVSEAATGGVVGLVERLKEKLDAHQAAVRAYGLAVHDEKCWWCREMPGRCKKGERLVALGEKE